MAVPFSVLITVVVGTTRPAGRAGQAWRRVGAGCWELVLPSAAVHTCSNALPELEDAVAVMVWRSSRPAPEGAGWELMWQRPARPAVGAAAAQRPPCCHSRPALAWRVLGVPLTVRQGAEAGRQQQHAEKTAHIEEVGVGLGAHG